MLYKNLKLGKPEEFNVLIEIPKNSSVSYEYDKELDVMKQDWIFKNNFSYPYNYGFAPQTLAGDGDAIDVFVITDQIIHPGSIVRCRPLGMLELIEEGEEDNKVIAVPIKDLNSTNLESLEDLSFDYKKVFEELFKELTIQKKKKEMIIKGYSDKHVAMDHLKKCSDNYSSGM